MRSEVEEMRSGVEEMRSGVEEMRSGVEEMRSEVEEMRSGVEEMRSGVEEMRSEAAWKCRLLLQSTTNTRINIASLRGGQLPGGHLLKVKVCK